MAKISAASLTSTFYFLKNAETSLARELAEHAQALSCPAKTRLYFTGDICSQIAFVASGSIRVYKIGETGREITLYEVGTGETCILNASCILSQTHYPAEAITLTDCTLIMLPAKQFSDLVHKHSSLRNFVFYLISERLALIMALIEEVVFGRLDERLEDYLLEKSEDNELRTTHQTIANDLGSSREVVSRLLKDFEKHGKVVLSRNSIRILM